MTFLAVCFFVAFFLWALTAVAANAGDASAREGLQFISFVMGAVGLALAIATVA